MATSKTITGAIACEYRIEGLDCPDCAATLERGVREVTGVVQADVYFGTSSLNVAVTSAEAVSRVRARVEAMGFRLAPIDEAPGEATTLWEQHGPLVLTGIAALAWLVGSVLNFSHEPLAAVVVFAFSILLGGLPIFRRAYGALLAKTLDIHVLMTIAVIGAAVIGDWGEGAAVVVLFAIGNVLEAVTTHRARKAIGKLMVQAPERATIRRDSREIVLPVEEARVGDIAVVRPGEKIPLDGRVIAGTSSVNEAPITGESLPQYKSQGDLVYAGTLNERGALELEIIKPYAESAFARIIHLVEDAQAVKPRLQQQIDRFARYYTPAIIAIAVLTGIGGWLLGVHDPVIRALALLIIGCPCALVLASPIATVAAISRAARQGMLVKKGAYLETGSAVRAIAFDKTGTLTRGQPQLDGIVTAGVEESAALALAAGLERYSEHPVGVAIRKAAQRAHVEPLPVTDFAAITGLGVRGTLEGEEVRLGNSRLWPSLDAEWDARVRQAEETGATVLLLERAGVIQALFALSDTPRPEVSMVVRHLQEDGFAVSLLTGDTFQAARYLGRQVGISDIAARLLPEQKVTRARELREQYGHIAMVGDGVNDAPVLAASDLGIAVAAVGNDTALASADVVLITDDLQTLPAFFALCRRTTRVIRQNIAFAVLLKLALVGFAIAGLLPLWLAVIGDVGASIVVMLSGMRLLR